MEDRLSDERVAELEGVCRNNQGGIHPEYSREKRFEQVWNDIGIALRELQAERLRSSAGPEGGPTWAEMQQQWRPNMDGAPTDGTEFIVWVRRLDEPPISWQPFPTLEARKQ